MRTFRQISRIVCRVALALLVSTALGCASIRNTPQQDLAWERWQKCKQSGVKLSRIEPDGRIWVTYAADHTVSLNAWRDCDRNARQEQRAPARASKHTEAQRLISEARLYEAQGRTGKAIQTYEEAVGLLPAAETDTAYRLLRQIVRLRSKAGQLDEAIAAAERQFRLVERVGPIPIGDGTFWRASSVLVELSWLHYRQGKFRDSLRYAEAAYAEREQDRPILANILARRGLARLELFDAERALVDFQEALRLTEGSHDLRFIANQHHNLGMAYFSNGNYQLAITSLEKAISIGRDLSTSPDLPIHLATLGRVYGHLNLFDVAHRYLDEAVQLARSMNDLSLVQNGLRRKSEVYRWQGDHTSALASAREALELAQMRGSVAAVGWLQWNIGYIYLTVGEHVRARESFRVAQQVSQRMENPTLATFTAFGLGQSHFQVGDYAAAEGYFSTIESVVRNLGTTGVTWRFWYAKGQLREAQGRLEEAFEAYADAIRQIESLRIKLPTVEKRASFIEDKQDAYEAVVRVLFRLGRVAGAFEYAERAKGRAFLDLLTQQRIKLRSFAARRDPLAEEVARLTEEVTQRQAEMSRASEPQAASSEALTRNADELRAAEDQWRDLQKQLKGRVRSYEGDASWAPLTTAAIQVALPPRTGLVSYYLGREEAWLFYVDRERVVGRRLNAAPSVIETDVASLRRAIMPQPGSSRVDFSDWTPAAARLHEALVAPIMVHVADKHHLIIAPHRVLHYLPFQTLIGGDGKVLIERVVISMLPSASTLALVDHRRSHRATGLGVANPVVPGLRRLPGAEQEVAALDRSWPSEILLHEAATKAAVTSRMGTPRILHFATHAELNRFAPLQSSLRLTPTEDNDGRLTVDEIFDLDVTAELVVLAACDTGVGIGYKGENGPIRAAQEHFFPPGDELVGLSRAFLYAGTPSLVATLWPVDDTSTASVMTKFYENLRVMPKADALRQAQLGLIQEGRSHDTRLARQPDPRGSALEETAASSRRSHPYFWAGFIFIGDGHSSLHE